MSSQSGATVQETAVDEQQQEPEESAEPRYQCPECDSTSVEEHEQRGELLCRECGLVIQESMIDESDRPRAFSAEEREKKARSGAPLTYTRHDMGVSTEIGSGSGELYKVSGRKRGQYYRLRKWHRRATRSSDRNLGYALSELKQLVSYLGLPDAVHEEVARLYEKAVKEGLVKGRRTEHMLAAITYIVARNQNTPRPLDEIADAVGSNKREVGKAYRYVARELDLRVLPARPEDYLPKFAGDIEASGEVHATARKIIKAAEDQDLLSGRGPTGIAAAALYIASAKEDEKRSQREVADALGVTEVTIRNRTQEFVDGLEFLEKEELGLS